MRIRTRFTDTAALGLCLTLILSALAFAHGDEVHVLGTIAKIDGSTITVKTTKGEEKTVLIVADTKFMKGSVAASQTDLKVGDRVVIHAKSEQGVLHATEVKIGQP